MYVYIYISICVHVSMRARVHGYICVCKHAMGIPLLKRPGLNEYLPSNYRPVSNLPFSDSCQKFWKKLSCDS